MRRLANPLRAALLGFITLFVIGAMIAAEDKNARKRFLQKAQERAEQSGERFDLIEQEPELQRAFARQVLVGMIGIGMFGALIALATLLVLRFAFPFGPASKIVIGAVCGPATPMLLLAPTEIAKGQGGGDLAGIVILGMLIGALTGVVEANRIFTLRRSEAIREGEKESGAGNRT